MKLVYREENSAADGFAKWVHGLDMLVISQDVNDLPRSLQKILFFDRIGLPYYRPNIIRGALFSCFGQQGFLMRPCFSFTYD